ncbi:MAG: cell wall hydrolase [Clostridia bacterium]|nr:cell wall hydrolase [Clostridia bacterium]NCC45012.1 cell wall hydrolase [Clostridia bacterium]
MEKLKKMMNSLRALASRTVKEHRRACIAAAAGAAVVLAGVGIAMSVKYTAGDKNQAQESVTTEQGTDRLQEKEDSPDDDPDPARQIPCGYAGVIDGVLSTKGLTKSYRAVGTSCEIVLVGQRMITSEVISRLEVGSRLVTTVEELDNQSWELAETTRMSDRDYENLLAIVEAESGGEDVEGRIMVANVILNRVSNEHFPSDVTSVIWERSGGSPQFSPTADGRIHTVTISDTTREAVNRAIDGEDLSKGALYFVAKKQADESNIDWFDKNLTFLFKHGEHSFYA